MRGARSSTTTASATTGSGPNVSLLRHRPVRHDEPVSSSTTGAHDVVRGPRASDRHLAALASDRGLPGAGAAEGPGGLAGPGRAVILHRDLDAVRAARPSSTCPTSRATAGARVVAQPWKVSAR